MRNAKPILLGLAAFALWSATSSVIFIFIDFMFHGRLYQIYPPPSLFWQWWHYALFGSDAVWTTKLLMISAALPTLLVVAGTVKAVIRQLNPTPQPLYGETRWADRTNLRDSGFGLRKKQ